MTGALRIAVIASARFPISEPFAGGLESHTWFLTRALRQRGHEVTVFAAPGSDPALGVEYLPVDTVAFSAAACADVSMGPGWWMAEHHAYLRLMLELAEQRDRFDVVHNNSLHHLPIAMAPMLAIPMVTTLHTPPTPWLESAIQACPDHGVVFAAVSARTAAAWRPTVPDAVVVRNGIDLDGWSVGSGGGPLVWAGGSHPRRAPISRSRPRGSRVGRCCWPARSPMGAIGVNRSSRASGVPSAMWVTCRSGNCATSSPGRAPCS